MGANRALASVALCGLLAACAPSATAPRAAASGEAPPAVVPAHPVLASGVHASTPAVNMLLSIPSIGVRDLLVVAYSGHADDLPGTRIEDRGWAASPQGRPGEVGNLLVTGHRTAAGGPLRLLPALRDGADILVTSGSAVYDYKVTDTMWISFRHQASLALQSAAVPGHPGRTPTLAMITLSTCATPEDHAAGNHWSDAFGNPEHRIDKVGVLWAVRSR